MNRLYPCILFLLIAISSFAQDLKPELSRQFIEYSQLVIDQEFDKALDYTIDDIFEIVAREQLKSIMETVFATPSVIFKIQLPKILDIDKEIVIDGANYARLKTETSLEMKFLPDPADPERTLGEQEEHDALILVSLQEQYGKSNVAFDKHSGFFKLKSIKNAVAKSIDGKNWKFAVIDNPQMKVLLGRFIPKQLLE